MKIPSWPDVEQRVSRALALEVISNSFPLPDAATMRTLTDDSDRILASLRALPDEFSAEQLDANLSNVIARLRQRYRDSLLQTLRSIIAQQPAREFVGV